MTHKQTLALSKAYSKAEAVGFLMFFGVVAGGLLVLLKT